METIKNLVLNTVNQGKKPYRKPPDYKKTQIIEPFVPPALVNIVNTAPVIQKKPIQIQKKPEIIEQSMDDMLDDLVGDRTRSNYQMQVEWIIPKTIKYRKNSQGDFMLDGDGNKILDKVWTYRSDIELHNCVKANIKVNTELGALFIVLRRIRKMYLWCRIWNNNNPDPHQREFLREYYYPDSNKSHIEINRMREEAALAPPIDFDLLRKNYLATQKNGNNTDNNSILLPD